MHACPHHTRALHSNAASSSWLSWLLSSVTLTRLVHPARDATLVSWLWARSSVSRVVSLLNDAGKLASLLNATSSALRPVSAEMPSGSVSSALLDRMSVRMPASRAMPSDKLRSGRSPDLLCSAHRAFSVQTRQARQCHTFGRTLSDMLSRLSPVQRQRAESTTPDPPSTSPTRRSVRMSSFWPDVKALATSGQVGAASAAGLASPAPPAAPPALASPTSSSSSASLTDGLAPRDSWAASSRRFRRLR